MAIDCAQILEEVDNMHSWSVGSSVMLCEYTCTVFQPKGWTVGYRPQIAFQHYMQNPIVNIDCQNQTDLTGESSYPTMWKIT